MSNTSAASNAMSSAMASSAPAGALEQTAHTPAATPAVSASGSRARYVFLAGAVSGIVEGLTIQPLEMLKTRFQIHEGRPLSLISTVREIVSEGGVRQLYRGALPEITGLVPRASAALSTLEFSQRLFRSRHPEGLLTPPMAYVSGALSGFSEALAFAPFQVVKVRLMAKEHLGRYKNTWDCATQVVRTEGVTALATGLVPTLYRNCIWNALYYGTMYELETNYMPVLIDPVLTVARTVVVGTAVGMVATTANIPFDVVKSRMQSQLPGARKYERVLPSLARIVREEGFFALYKGYLPKALRLGIGQTFGLLVFQNCLRLFGAEEVA